MARAIRAGALIFPWLSVVSACLWHSQSERGPIPLNLDVLLRLSLSLN